MPLKIHVEAPRSKGMVLEGGALGTRSGLNKVMREVPFDGIIGSVPLDERGPLLSLPHEDTGIRHLPIVGQEVSSHQKLN